MDRLLAIGRATTMMLMELRFIGREGHSTGQGFGMGGMITDQGLVPRVG